MRCISMLRSRRTRLGAFSSIALALVALTGLANWIRTRDPTPTGAALLALMPDTTHSVGVVQIPRYSDEREPFDESALWAISGFAELVFEAAGAGRAAYLSAWHEAPAWQAVGVSGTVERKPDGSFDIARMNPIVVRAYDKPLHDPTKDLTELLDEGAIVQTGQIGDTRIYRAADTPEFTVSAQPSLGLYFAIVDAQTCIAAYDQETVEQAVRRARGGYTAIPTPLREATRLLPRQSLGYVIRTNQSGDAALGVRPAGDSPQPNCRAVVMASRLGTLPEFIVDVVSTTRDADLSRVLALFTSGGAAQVSKDESVEIRRTGLLANGPVRFRPRPNKMAKARGAAMAFGMGMGFLYECVFLGIPIDSPSADTATPQAAPQASE